MGERPWGPTDRRWLRAGLFLWAGVLAGCGKDGPTEPEAEAVSLSELFGTQIFSANGAPVGLAALESAQVIGIYFASAGCPACQAFNPVLAETYADLKAEERPFEVVLVTSAISLAAMFDYMDEGNMEWLAISPLSGKANVLANRFNVRWVPTLILIDSDGMLLSESGREQVAQLGAGAWSVWTAEIAP